MLEIGQPRGDASSFASERSLAAAWDIWLTRWQKPADIIQRSTARLRSLLGFARNEAPLYRRLYRDLPPLQQLRLADLPVVDKPTLMADLTASLTVRDLSYAEIERFLAEAPVGSLLRGRYAVWTSSGTTGKAGIFLHDRDALAIYDALEMFRFRGLSAPAEFAARLLAGERYALVAATGGHFAGAASIERLRQAYPWLAPRMQVFSLLQPLPALVRALNEYAPTLVATYPTAADVLADEQLAGRLHLALSELWTGGECLCDAVRTRLARVFNCRVRNGYGASEFLSIAAECGHGVLHVNSDWVLLEPVDASYRVLDPGETSHTVLLTNLANGVQPLIRYDLGDSITVLPAPCECGSVLPAIRVEGRRDDVLTCADGRGETVKLLPLVLTTVLEDNACVHDFQLEQCGPARLRLRLGAPERSRAARALAALREYLRAQGLPTVAIEVADEAPQRDRASGKLRRVICAEHLRALRAYTDRAQSAPCSSA